MKQRGFTLIELLVVISVMAILSTGALAAYRNYSNAQILQSTANEFYDTLQSAKTEAQSQVKPTVCAGMTLNNYNVTYGSGTSYSLNASCTDSSGNLLTEPLITKQLPSGGYTISDSSTNNIVSFNVLSAGVSFEPRLTLSNGVSINVNSPNGSIKIITVTANGQISIN